MTIRFTVYGVPVPKARHRTARLRTGRSVTYTPRSTVVWEESTRWQALQHRPEQLMEGPLSVRLLFFLPRPKSAPKRRRFPDCKPDVDNVGKAIKDALKGIIYRDDSQITTSLCAKRYGDPPRVEIEVWHEEGDIDGV